jgi:hypothetical protein
MKAKVIEQLTRTPLVEQRIKVYTAPGVTETCIQPPHCKQGFGRPADTPGCYNNRCPCTEICKRVGNKRLRWEYV